MVTPARQATALGLLVFVTYLATLAPGLMYTDSGELAAACAVYGVAHPTGYPLFTLLGHVWTLLPWPSAIFGLNVLAALWTATAVGVTYRLCYEVAAFVGGGKNVGLAATTASLLFAWSGTVWAQATTIEVYSLHAVLVAAALFSVVRSITQSERSWQWSALAGVFTGAMLANHLSSVFLLPGIVVMWLSANNRRERLRSAHVVVLPALLLVALYILLPLRSAQEPPINWGMVHRGWDAFLYHVKGTQFGVWFFSDKKAAAANAVLFRDIVLTMTLWVGIIPVIVGATRLLRGKALFAAGLGAVVVGNCGATFGYAIPDIEPYFLPSLVVVAVALAVGLCSVLHRLPKYLRYAVVATPLVLLVLQAPKQNLRNHTAVDNYTTWVLDNAEPNAIILTRQWDFFCSAAWYRQTINNERPDVAIIDKELLRRTWYIPFLEQRYPHVMKGAKNSAENFMVYLERFEADGDSFNKRTQDVVTIQQRFVAFLNALLDSNASRPLYVTPELLNEEQGFAAGYSRIPAGPLVRLVRPGIDYRQRHTSNGTSQLVECLRTRSTRLDSGLSSVAGNAFATMALYRLDAFSDTVSFRIYRDLVRRLDQQSPASRHLNGILP